MIVEQSDGCILWDCLSLIDRLAIDYINARGGLKAIALSHPYFYGAMSAWSEAFGGVPAYVHEADREWVMTLKTITSAEHFALLAAAAVLPVDAKLLEA